MRRPNARHRRSERESDPPADPDSKMDSFSIKSLQFKQNSSSRSNLFSKSLRQQPRYKFLTISLICISLSIVCYLFFAFFRHRATGDSTRFGIIIDGGSTGTRIHVFEYTIEGGVPRFNFGSNGHWSMRVSPGLSSYEEDSDRAGESLMDLLQFGKRRVPKELWGETEIRLMATAGLRLLNVKVQQSILESCRRVLRFSGFKFHDDWASVITGSDEGLYAWVVANYALGTLGGDPHQTTGIIELGGASAQVTFVSSESLPHEFFRTLKYGNATYNLYSNSLLHYGQNVAFDSLKELLVSNGPKSVTEISMKEVTIDPCTPKGYGQDAESSNYSPDSLSQKYTSAFHAVGNFSECRAAALKLLDKGKEDCSYRHCTLGSTFMPKLHGRFLATENFFYTSKFFGLHPKASLSDLMVAGQQFCEEDWSNIRSKHSSHEEEDLLHYCFSSAYIVALLHDSLGISLDDGRIGYANQVENIPLDWALGAFIVQTTNGINGGSHGWITSVPSDSFSNLFLLMGAIILLIVVAWCVSQWRKPSFKTIYDLEKGRYIVTRISR